MNQYLSALIQYQHYHSFIQDFNLLCNTDLFNTHYYLSYHPNLTKKKINPRLHYLLYGGFAGHDPSPNFDSSWYTNNNPEVKKTRANPLVHYLKYGINDQLSPYSSGPRIHIEFLGINGSGKSTLYYEANKYLQRILGYNPGPLSLWTRIINDVRFTAMGNFSTYYFDFLYKNFSFVKDVYRSNIEYFAKDYYVQEWPKVKMHYFSILCAYYQAIISDHTKTWSMLDEGFCSNLKNYIVNHDGKIDKEVSARVLNLMPKPELLFHVNTDIGLCKLRLEKRKNGIPVPFQHLSDKDFLYFLSEQDHVNKQFVEIIKNSDTKVIVINNQDSLSRSVTKVIEAISGLLELKDCI